MHSTNIFISQPTADDVQQAFRLYVERMHSVLNPDFQYMAERGMHLIEVAVLWSPDAHMPGHGYQRVPGLYDRHASAMVRYFKDNNHCFKDSFGDTERAWQLGVQRIVMPSFVAYLLQSTLEEFQLPLPALIRVVIDSYPRGFPLRDTRVTYDTPAPPLRHTGHLEPRIRSSVNAEFPNDIGYEVVDYVSELAPSPVIIMQPDFFVITV